MRDLQTADSRRHGAQAWPRKGASSPENQKGQAKSERRQLRSHQDRRARGQEPVGLKGRELSWDGCVNVRDLGGGGADQTGCGGPYGGARAVDRGRVGGGPWTHGVRTVVDLRDAGECEPDRAPRPAGITTVQVPLDPVGTPFYEHWKKIDNLASPLYFPAMLAEHPEPVITAVRAIANAVPDAWCSTAPTGRAGPAWWPWYCSRWPERRDYRRLPAELRPIKQRYAELGVPDQLAAVQELLASRNNTIEASLTSTIASLTMPGFLLHNGLSDTELAALHTRLTT